MNEEVATLKRTVETLTSDLQEAKSNVTNLSAKFDNLQEDYKNHNHNSKNSKEVSSSDVVPQTRASGSITMATDGQTYNLGLVSNPTSIMFYGGIFHTSGSIDMRAHSVGNAQLGKSFYFQPQSSNSVITGGEPQDIIQSASAFLIDSSTAPVTVRLVVSEGHLVSLEYPTGTVVARATVTDFTNDHVSVLVSLASGWSIVGNFVVT